jgi:hypothetical protein
MWAIGKRWAGAIAQRRRVALATAAAIIALIAIPWALGGAAGASNEGAHIGNTAASLWSLLAARSPGERTSAELIKTKATPSASIPREIVFKTIAPPVAPESAIVLVAPGTPSLDSGGPLLPTGSFVIAGPSPNSGGGAGPPGLAGPSGPFGPAGPPTLPGPPGSLEPPPEPIGPPAVPEPATWAMMVIGFALIGWTMRKHKAASCDLAVS